MELSNPWNCGLRFQKLMTSSSRFGQAWIALALKSKVCHASPLSLRLGAKRMLVTVPRRAGAPKGG
eukprot:1247072-Pyramimonas_sp.AAC.1